MSEPVRVRTIQTRTFRPCRGADLFPALVDPELERCSPPSTPSLHDRLFAWHSAEDDADHRRAGVAHSLLLQPDRWDATGYSSTAAWLRRRPYTDALQKGVSRKRHLSRIFPAHPRSLARCLSRALRHSAFCFGCAALRVWVSKEKISLRLRPLRARFFLRSLRRKTRLRHLGAGHLPSLRARVSRGQSGQIQTGEMTWHSTKTKSL